MSMHGGQSLPPSKQQLVEALIEDGATIQDIMDQVGCSRATVFNYKRNLKDFGTVLAPSISRMGRPPTLTDEMVEV
jgi:transposase